jgi:hypothetical protein
VLDAQGAVRAVGAERAPVGGTLHPTSAWQVGEVVRDQYDIPLAAGLGAGSYRLKLALSVSGGPSVPEVVLDAFPVQ